MTGRFKTGLQGDETRLVTKTRNLRSFRSAEYLEGIFQLAEELALDKHERDALGERYKQARLLAGLKQKDMAQLLDYTERRIGAYERGEVQEGLRVARVWAEATGVRYEWLVTGDGEPLAGDPADRLGRIEELLEGLLGEIRQLRVDGEAREAAG